MTLQQKYMVMFVILILLFIACSIGLLREIYEDHQVKKHLDKSKTTHRQRVNYLHAYFQRKYKIRRPEFKGLKHQALTNIYHQCEQENIAYNRKEVHDFVYNKMLEILLNQDLTRVVAKREVTQSVNANSTDEFIKQNNRKYARLSRLQQIEGDYVFDAMKHSVDWVIQWPP